MPRFTSATARAARAKRDAKKVAGGGGDIAPTSPAPDEPRVPPSMHGGLPPVEAASVVVTAPPPAPVEPEVEPAAAAPETKPAASEVQLAPTPFSPAVTKMLANIAFDTVGVVTGKPHIWKLDDEEIEPLTEGIGHQLARIPLVKAIGPDNTELAVVVLGMGVIVTKRLNEHAEENERERQEKARRLAAGGGDIAPSTRTAPAAAAPSGGGEFASEMPAGLHVGLRH